MSAALLVGCAGQDAATGAPDPAPTTAARAGETTGATTEPPGTTEAPAEPAASTTGPPGSLSSPSIGIETDPSVPPSPPSIPPTTAPPPLAPLARPYTIAATQLTFTDEARSAGGVPRRVLRTTVRYPQASGPFPLVVFAHGWAVAAADYGSLLDAVAAAGYVVAAPDFPLTSSANGAIDEMDTFNQPYDLSFLVSRLQSDANRSGPFAGRVWTGAVGAMGQSDGAMTVLGMGDNSCCLDERLAGVVALSGKVTGWANGWFPANSRPVLAVHGTNDTINPFPFGQQLFDQSPAGSALLTVDGGDHFGIFANGGAAVPTIAAAVIAFFDATIRKDPGARTALTATGATPGFSLKTK